VIEVSELTKYYGDKKAAGPLTFAIEQGEVVGLLGLNGAGKTTTLRMLSSDLLPTSGSMRIDGIDLLDRPDDVRPKIGYLPDRPPLYDEMEVSEYLRFAAKLRGERVAEVVELTDLGAERNSRIGTLSHGYRQRVGIAQAIVHGPKLLLLDEPISGLDPEQIVGMRRLVRSLAGEHTTLLSSHILSEISETCDRLLVIREGEIVATGSERQLAAQMAAAHNVELTARVEGGIDALLAVVEKLEGVSDVVERPTDAPGPAYRVAAGEVVTVRVSGERDVREDLCRALVEADIGILGLELRAAGELESVFLRLTGRAHAAEDES
jgi:ABC-2 type transport system ATP-binding protein